jgi:pilus assembly protein CpaE
MTTPTPPPTTPPTTLLLASSSAMAALPAAARAASPDDLVARLDGRRGPEAVVLGPGLQLAAVLELVRRYRVWRPEVGFVLERHHLRQDEREQAREAGVRDVVVVGDLGGLASAVARSAGTATTEARSPAPAPETPRGRVTTVFSAKGGTGVTTVCTNLAAALADGGRRSVVLVDLDLTLGDVAASLSLSPGASIADAVPSGAGGLALAELHRLLTPHSPGLSTLLAPGRAGAAASVSPALVARVLDLLGGSFDHVVVDTPTSLDASVLTATAASDTVVHVTTPDIPSVRHLLATLQTLEQLEQPEDRWRVVLNRSGSKVGLAVHEVERLLGRAVTGHLPSSVDVPASLNKGVPLLLQAPGHPFSRAVSAFAASELVGGRRPAAVDLREAPPVPLREWVAGAAGLAPGGAAGPARRTLRLPPLTR